MCQLIFEQSHIMCTLGPQHIKFTYHYYLYLASVLGEKNLHFFQLAHQNILD